MKCVMEHVPSPAPMLQQQHKRPFIDLNEPYVEPPAASQPAETSSRVRPIPMETDNLMGQLRWMGGPRETVTVAETERLMDMQIHTRIDEGID